MTRPNHLIIANGHLYDSREKDWYSGAPLRARFAWQTQHIETTQQLKAALRAGKYAWPGKYRLAFITAAYTYLSFEAVRQELKSVISSIREQRIDGWRVIGLRDVDSHDEPVYCAHSGEQVGGPPAFDHYEFYKNVVVHGQGDPIPVAYQLAEELVLDNYDYPEIGQLVVAMGMLENVD